MTYTLYNVAATLAAPLAAAGLALRPKHRVLLHRFAPPVPALKGRPIWVQACSVGEVNTARPIVRAIAARWPETPIVLTASTAAGHAVAADSRGEFLPAWFPFDHPLIVRRFVRGLNPRALVLMETEIWPNVIRETRRHGAPVILVNGRLSDKHYARCRRWHAWLRPVFAGITAAGMQNREYVDRFVALGGAPAAARITGNTKFDGVNTRIDPEARARLRAEMGLGADAPLLLFGSTRPGDEALAARCWRTLREEFPALHLIVVPRHIDRLREALSHFDEPVLRRSEIAQGRRTGMEGRAPSRPPLSERVLVVDTVGELAAFYAIATVAVVGGSFYPGVEGHNPLEAAAQGVATVFGPHMRNFIDPARVLTECGGARQLDYPDALLHALRDLLRDPASRELLGMRAREAVFANQGAIQRTIEMLESVLT